MFARSLASLLLSLVLVRCGGEESGDGHDHGTRHDLGRAKAGSFEVSVVLYGEVEAGGEVALDVGLKGPRLVAAVSARLSDADGMGTVNEPLPRQGDSARFHGHLLVPDGLPNGVALWIRVKDTEGESQEARFSLP